MKKAYLLNSLTAIVALSSSEILAEGKFNTETGGCELTNSKNINVVKEGKADGITGQETESMNNEQAGDDIGNNESMHDGAWIITKSEEECSKLGEAVENRKNFDQEKTEGNQFSDKFIEDFGEYKEKLDPELFG